jgi:hypothetical protein
MTPERACTALLVDATREAVCSCASRSADKRESFISGYVWLRGGVGAVKM